MIVALELKSRELERSHFGQEITVSSVIRGIITAWLTEQATKTK